MFKKKMLITGVSGLLGNNLAYYFKNKYKILGLYYSHPVLIDGVHIKECDLSYYDKTKNIIDKFDPAIIIHCASLTNVDQCEKNPEIVRKVNVISAKNIVEIVLEKDVKLIYISTDSVYDGVNGNFSEDDTIKPLNCYGRSKYEGELEVLRKKESVILRTNLFGWNIQEKKSLGEWILSELKADRKIQGFKDVNFSTLYTLELARIIDMVIKSKLNGIYNCGGSDSCSKYEFAMKIADRFGFDKEQIMPISIDDFLFKAKRGKNLSLNVTKLQKDLDYKLPTIDQSIEEFYRDYRCGLSDEIKQNNFYKQEKSFSISYGRHWVDEDDIQAVTEVLRSDWITQGPKIKEFEAALCAYTGAKYAVAVSSGTAALHIACLSAGLKENEEFITSPNTFVASANCGVYCGAKPVFADIEENTYNIDPQKIKEKITQKTKIVIPVHFAGQICDMEKINQIVQEKQNQYKEKIFIIEDASHALGSIYKGSKAGSCTYSDMTVMSFHPVKHITTGEGGVVFTNDEKLYKKLKLFRSHGITNKEDELVSKKQAYSPSDLNSWYYEQQVLGFNYRITDIQCALGISQLEKIDFFLRRRQRIFETYNNAFIDNKFITLPFESSDCFTNWHLYVIQIDFDAFGKDRADIMKRLKDKGIGTQVHYIPVHTQPFYIKSFGTNWGDCPYAEAYYRRCLSLPIFPAMTEEDVLVVIGAIRDLEKR